MSDVLSREEFAAYAVEEVERAPQAVKGWVADLLGQLKAWILRRFGRQFGQVTPQQLRALAVSALKSQAREQTRQGNPKSSSESLRLSIGRDEALRLEDPVQTRAFLDSEPVASMRGDEVPKFNKTSELVDWAAKHFADTTTDGVVENAQLGEIGLNRRSVRDSLGHGYGKDKIQALYLLPQALPQAQVLSIEERNHTETGYILGAPIEIGGKPFVMAMLIKRNEGGQKLYVHEVVLREKLQSAINTAASAVSQKTGELTQDNSGAIRTVLEKIYTVNNQKDSRKYSIADSARERISEVTPARVVQELQGKWTDWKPKLLATVPLNYFSELKRPNMVAVDEYLKTKRALDAYRGKKHADADALAQKWLKLAKFGKKNIQALSDMMHESTLAGIDPSKTDAETKAKKGYDALRRKFNKLPPVAQQLYQEVREAYKKQAQELDEIILANIEKTEKIAQEKLVLF